jgi:hypothetical protein
MTCLNQPPSVFLRVLCASVVQIHFFVFSVFLVVKFHLAAQNPDRFGRVSQ